MEELHQQLMENVAESDDTLLEKFFEEGELSYDEISTGLKGALSQQTFIPVFAVSSATSVGVPQLMDFQAAHALTPGYLLGRVLSDGETLEVGLEDGSRCSPFSKPSASRMSGNFHSFDSTAVWNWMNLINTGRNHQERVGQIFHKNGKERTQVKSIQAGDPAAFVKLKDTHTCDTLSDPKTKLKLPGIDFPAPNLSGALKLKSKGEEEKMSLHFDAYEEDPTFIYRLIRNFTKT